MKEGLKLGGKALVYYVILALLSLLFLSFLGESGQWLQIILNVALLAGFAVMLLNDGGYRGEKACTLQASIDKQREEGRPVDPVAETQVFHKNNAVIGFIVGALPLLLLALVNLAVEPYYPAYTPVTEAEVVAAQPSEDGAIDRDAADAYAAEEAVPINWVNVITRAVFMPFVSLYTLLAYQPHTLYLLFIPLSFLLPAFESAGYLMGPGLRDKKLKDIQKGKRRKMRNLKVNKKPREPKKPKMEV